MVFSQTSHKTQSILKVVDIDCLKSNKEQETNGETGVIAGGILEVIPSLSTPATSFSEEFLKLEPTYDSTMFHDSDCEFFQDLVQWCSDPAKEEPVQTIDSTKVTEERAHNNDILHTPFSPQGWEAIDPKSPTAPAGAYISPEDSLSPGLVGIGQYTKPLTPQGLCNTNTMQYQEEFLDFNNMPVVFGDLESEKPVGLDPAQAAGLFGWEQHTYNTNDTNTHLVNTQMPFEEDSKLVSVIPRELESNDVIITEVIFGPSPAQARDVKVAGGKQRQGLTVNIPARTFGWPTDLISTPDVVNCVEQLETDNLPLLPMLTTDEWPVEDTETVSGEVEVKKSPPPVDYEPITPKSESQAESENEEPYTRRKRRYDSEVSDETYTPYQETTPRRKYTRRKPNIPIVDMIKELEGSQPLKKAKRGRPPKRRDSNVSSICSIDENSSIASTHETNYRKLRDKNNEASKRSRMNRKLKELQMEQQALDLEEKNKKLQIKADILEDMTKRLKDALMTAILHKQ
ncbi:unnamed protein product [Chilo suppressalis]|uniref:BZIP domain-containing protein n=1 Tax=Chilo suppressalis TaxID=168631 RepID=A0ABN8L5C1_CHISP|nr:unnamed protein product [Chilo suppressalis]